jgi:hypothetical protein
VDMFIVNFYGFVNCSESIAAFSNFFFSRRNPKRTPSYENGNKKKKKKRQSLAQGDFSSVASLPEKNSRVVWNNIWNLSQYLRIFICPIFFLDFSRNPKQSAETSLEKTVI